MILNLILKQLRLIIRDRQHIALLLAMPLVLIFIIKFAIADMMNQQAPDIQATIAIAEHSNEEADLQNVIEELMELPMSEENMQAVEADIAAFQPIEILKEQVFGHEDVKEMFTIEEITPDTIEQAKEDESYAAIIEVPESFSYDLLKSIISDENDQPQLTLYVNQSEELVPNIINDLLLTYEEQMKINTVLGQHGLSELVVTTEDIQGEIRSISKVEPISGTMYYVVGMSVMFVLFIAATMGSYAYEEKRIHVFDRILLANVSRWIYFTGTFTASTILALVQLFLLYGFAALIFGVTWPNIVQFLVITLCLSFSVGGIASLLTAINFRLQSENASTVFSSAIVMVFAFLGGSFFPVGNSSDLVKFIGDMTPNGAGMSAYLTSAQGYGFSEIGSYLMFMLIFTIVMLVAAIVTFPKRGQEA
ncbi:ABC transporter permease [Aquibacillus albus]|uniref:ABC-2 type transport system permease protein n=1 Tax=Aquibacillus albus TaxID=1168171 RepID=A0ABS2MVN9_9BACI|nr:ABC transporter permease [Aquibacillus albus]MBM7569957.1 ABC-2 type transport system permease protein [Aquibacillus albus]